MTENGWRRLVDELPQFIWTASPDGLRDFCNKQWIEYTGLPFSEQLGTKWLKTVHEDDRQKVETAWNAAVATFQPFHLQYRIRGKDGSYRWFLTRGSPLRDIAEGPVTEWLGSATDVDAQKHTEEHLQSSVSANQVALAEAQEHATRAALSKAEFLAVISHEIRTPLNGVMGMAHLLEDTPLTDEQRDYLATIQSEAETLLATVNEMLDFSKIEAGGLKLEHSEFDVRSIVQESLELVAIPAAAKNLELMQDVSAEVPATAIGDAERLRQIVLNLLSNAVKFTERGSIRVSAGLEGMRNNFAVLRFSVSDTGIGVPLDRQAAIFQPFTQADSSLARRFGGSGLGLSIAKRLVELMGGTIGVSSQLGAGATFSFTVCLQPVAAQSGAVQTLRVGEADDKADLRNVFANRLCRVLLVEDSVSSQQVALGILQKMGLRADIAADGVEALGAVRKFRYDLILMDVRMPNMDGLEAAQRIRNIESGTEGQPERLRIPIVGMTASAMQGDRESCLEAGMDDYVAKPIMPRALRTVLDRWLPKEEDSALAVLDLTALMSRLMGDEKLADKVLDAFVKDIPQQIENLAACLASARAVGIQHQAHRIKGAAATVGGEAMRAVASEMELAAKAGDLGALELRLRELNMEFGRLREAIAKHKSEDPQTAGTWASLHAEEKSRLD